MLYHDIMLYRDGTLFINKRASRRVSVQINRFPSSFSFFYFGRTLKQ